jgi:hypothetical protein
MSATWNSLQDIWRRHMKGKGGTNFDSGDQAEIGGEPIVDSLVSVLTRFAERFWVDLSIQNPLESDITLGDLTVVVEADAEVIEEVMLGPRETRLVCSCIIPAISSGRLAHLSNRIPGPNRSHTPLIWFPNNSFCTIPFPSSITDYRTTFNPWSAAQRHSSSKTRHCLCSRHFPQN